MSGSNCCILSYRQVSQEAGKVVWISISLRIFHFAMIYRVKGFSVVNEVDIFSGILYLFYDQMSVRSLISGSSVFSKSNLYIWKFSVHILLKPNLKDFEHYFLACEMTVVAQLFEHSWASLIAQLVKNCLQCRRPQFDSWVRKMHWRRDRLRTPVFLGFPCDLAGKEYVCNVRDLGLNPGLGRPLGEGKVYPLQYSGLENSIGWIVHGVAKNQTQLNNFHFHIL